MQELQQTQRAIDASQVNGWGVDADPENDPTFPMKTHVEGEHKPYTGHRPTRPDQQTSSVEVLHSNERPNVSAVFGTTVPPSGVSGMIRRAAFNFSENSYGHWLPLMLADRVQMVEGLVDDLAHGHIPNIFSELGWKAQWKHDRKAVVTKVAVGTALAVGIYALLRSRRNRSEEEYSADNGVANGNDPDTAAIRPMANRSGIHSVRAAQTATMQSQLDIKMGTSTSEAATKTDESTAGQEGSMKMSAGQSSTKGGSSESQSKMSGSETSSETSGSHGSTTADQQAARWGQATQQKPSTSAKPKTDNDTARGI